MARICTCTRCKAEDFVRSIYPNLDDRRVLLMAQDIVKAVYASYAENRPKAD
jgi:hypothetical protein